MIEKWQNDIDERHPRNRSPENMIRDSFFYRKPIELTDDEWLGVFAKEQEKTIDSRERVFQKAVLSNPNRYIQLIKNHPFADPAMIETLLFTVREADIPQREKYELVRFAMQYKSHGCQLAFLSLAQSLMPFEFDKDIIDYIIEISICSVSDIEESWRPDNGGYYGDILTCGLNTPRGSAIWFFYKSLHDAPEQFEPIVLNIIDKLAAIESDSIQPYVFLLLLALSKNHKDSVLKLAKQMLNQASIHVLATNACEDILVYILWHEPDTAIPIINRLLDASEQGIKDESKELDHKRSVGKLATLARIYHNMPSVNALLEKALQGCPGTRQGIALCICEAVKFHEHQQLAVDILKKLFRDPDVEVRQFATHCFRNLLDLDEITSHIDNLICCFISSSAFSNNSCLGFFDCHDFFDFLIESKVPMTLHSINALEMFLKHYAAEQEQEQSQHKYLGYVEKLAYKIYAISKGRDERRRILKLINSLYEYHLIGESHLQLLER